MRIATRTITNNALQRLQDRLQGLEAAHEQLATGKRIRRPSDDIAGTVRSMGLHSGIKSLDQAERNAHDGLALTRATDSALQSVMNRLQRARELTVQGANSIANGEAVAAEIESLEEDLVTLANTRYRNRPLFGGTSGADAVTGTAGSRTFGGNDGEVHRRVGDGLSITVNVTADDVLGIGEPDGVLTVLDDLAASLRAGDTAAVDTAIADLDTAMDRVGDALTRIGSADRRLEASRDRAELSGIDAKQHVSQIEDADFAETVMELQLEQATYEAALNAFGRSLQLSLTGFLR